jgi:hypothetical protein
MGDQESCLPDSLPDGPSGLGITTQSEQSSVKKGKLRLGEGNFPRSIAHTIGDRANRGQCFPWWWWPGECSLMISSLVEDQLLADPVKMEYWSLEDFNYLWGSAYFS